MPDDFNAWLEANMHTPEEMRVMLPRWTKPRLRMHVLPRKKAGEFRAVPSKEFPPASWFDIWLGWV